MDHFTIYLILAGVFGLFMAWGIGANDVANAMATSVGSKALTIKQAIIVAAIFEFAGAFLAGGQVTKTIRKGIIDPAPLTENPDFLIFGMLASLLAAGTWLLIASNKGWPVSTTHSIVGAIVGFAIVGIGMEAVQWGKVGSIAASWVVSPVLSGFVAFMLFMSVQKLVLNTDDPFANAKRFVPGYIFLVGFLISLVTLFKGLKHIGLELTLDQSYMIAFVIGIGTALIGAFFVRRITLPDDANRHTRFIYVERVFGVLMIFTACAMAFAHGSNDVANAVGPVAAVVGIVGSGGELAQKSALPTWVLLLGGGGIVAGLAMYGRRVIATVGRHITELTPSRGFAAELAAATTVVIASGTGIPISTTHTLVGAVLGVGIARGISALDLTVVRNIFMSWIITLPAGAILSILFFFMLKGMFT
ncbi:MAG: inorganic phosphate transporter [Pseudomonadota bacterium]